MKDITAILSAYFAAGSVPATLYIGLVSATNYTGFDRVNDTINSHPGWEEFTAYTEATRQAWVPGVVIDDYPASVQNPTNSTVTPSSDGEVVGVFLCSNSTKGGTSGQLIGPFLFDEGPRQAITGSPFDVVVNVKIKYATGVI